MLINTTKQMKQRNIMLVTAALKSRGSATKADIAAQTGLSLATCGTILNELCAQGEALAGQVDESSGGRPAQRYQYNPQFFNVLSLYFSGSDSQGVISLVVSSASGSLIVSNDISYQNLTLDTFFTIVAEQLRNYPLIKAIGVGIPGVVADGHIPSCDISCLADVPLGQLLQQRFGRYVQIGNDMNYSALGFQRHNCPDEREPIAYIYMPAKYCAGCGIVIAGQMLRGASQFAGEVAKLPGYRFPNANGHDDKADVLDNLHRVIASLIAILNPVTIAISGELLQQADLVQAQQALAKDFDQAHIPQLVFRDSLQHDYHQGIIAYTTDSYNLFRLQNEHS